MPRIAAWIHAFCLTDSQKGSVPTRTNMPGMRAVPLTANHKLLTKVTDMRNRTAKRGQAEFEKYPQHLQRRPAGERSRLNRYCVESRHRVPSRILKQRHEPEIHVQLLVTVKKRSPRIVRHEIKLQLLKSAEHHDVFQDAGGGFATDPRQLEAVPM